MSIDWIHFSPLTAFVGGVLIGLAAALFALFMGRIAGISGIVGGLLRFHRGDVAWRIAFVVGLILAPFAYQGFAVLPEVQVDAGWLMLIAAGLIVGFGARYGSGCTSGHGVCGLSRGSLRSLAATITFMATGFLTVFIVRHWLGA